MNKISKLKNLGPKSEQWLNAIGVHNLEDLKAMGLLIVVKYSKLMDIM